VLIDLPSIELLALKRVLFECLVCSWRDFVVVFVVEGDESAEDDMGDLLLACRSVFCSIIKCPPRSSGDCTGESVA